MKMMGIRLRGSLRLLSIVFLVGIMLWISACSHSSSTSPREETGQDTIQVTATIGMIADVAAQVGKEHVDVTGLMGEGVDPHIYKATQGDIAKLEDADIIFYNGLHLEGKMGEILEAMNQDKPTIAVAEAIDPTLLLAGDPALNGEYDPHVWFDVSHWITVTEVIRDELIRLDPPNVEAYQVNAEAYIAELEKLHQYAKAQIALIPEHRRILVTAHDAFGYFGKAYGIEVKGLQGLSTASEAGSRDISQLRDFLIDHDIKAIFVESSVSSRSIDAVREGAREKGHEVAIGGKLFSDAMGAEGTEEGTYIGMVRHNVDTIVSALQ